MTRVYADMVADLFHAGHVEFLRRARELGDELVVGVHSDEEATAYKRRPFMTMEERIRVVESCRWVDQVVPAAPTTVSAEWIDRYSIDLVVHGDDFDTNALRKYYAVPIERGIFRTVPYTSGISTSEIVRRVEERVSRDPGEDADVD
jgi:cytidyltransferase-like protein